MVKVVFFEKPGCGNNTRQKALLAASGHEVEARDLLTTPWTPECLRAFFGDKPVAEWFNKAAPRVKSGEVRPDDHSEVEAIAAMLAEPLLIRRPLMEVDGTRVVGFDRDQVANWIGLIEDGKDAPETCKRTEETRCGQ